MVWQALEKGTKWKGCRSSYYTAVVEVSDFSAWHVAVVSWDGCIQGADAVGFVEHAVISWCSQALDCWGRGTIWN